MSEKKATPTRKTVPGKPGMPKATGSLEGFYRSCTPAPVRSKSEGAAVDAVNLPVPPLELPKKSVNLQVPPLEPETRRSPREMMQRQRSSPREMLQRQRSSRVLESTFAFKAAPAAFVPKPKLSDAADPSMVCTVAYRGMEVIFSTAKTPNPVVFCLCVRTRVILQTLDLPSSGQVVSLLAHPSTGMVTVGMSSGTLQTYHPMPTNSKISSDPSTVVSAFGKFRWVNGNVIKCRETFYGKGVQTKDVFCHPSLRGSGDAVDISCSADNKVLVAHRDQLAVFDATLVDMIFDEDGEMRRELPQAELLWTVRLERRVEMATLSGDGRAIAVLVEGEGLENDLPFGVRTFLRDTDDGSSLRSEVLEPPIERKGRPVLMRSLTSSKSVGILYRPGPVLVHPSSVSMVSFRGFGHVNSDVNPDEDEGNDLLLTYCRNDSSIRVFSQDSWKKLIEWNTPPDTRVDWVHGLSAFSLGDLERYKRKKKSGSAVSSRRPSFDDSSKAINADLLGSRPPTYQGSNTAAGAWISELTFRNGFPALRLSRLSYIKRSGDEMTPAHFESIAAILPFSSLVAESVLGMGDTGFSVQGIWPAWNPWRSESSVDETDGTLSGSAMAFLGLSSTTPSPAGFFGETHQAGTHSPPSELRLVASHPVSGKVILMEFPLWGDTDFGAMELGSPLRYELSLSEVDGADRNPKAIKIATEESAKFITFSTNDKVTPLVSLDYESSILCGQIAVEGKSVAITWRKPGSMSVLPVSKEYERHDSLLSVCSSDSIDSSYSHSYFDARPNSDEVQVFKDMSVIPAPLSLPPLRLPRSADSTGKEVFVAVKWWSDVTFSGPPQLLAVTSIGTLLMYELSPPWSTLEPPMPSDDVFIRSAASSIVGGDNGSMTASIGESFGEDVDQGEYDVMITPHPDFGIGLRLEAQIDGMPAIAGSFKTHPLNKGQLPAEKAGMIVLGDELVSVNGITLEGISFDAIIATVRQVGAEAPKGSPICMRFRPAIENRRRINSSAFSLSASLGDEVDGSNRRTMEQILGVNLRQEKQEIDCWPKSALHFDKKDSNAEIETQQEFSRIVALVPGALPSAHFTDGTDYQSRLTVLPWHEGISPSSQRLRGLLLLIVAEGSRMYAKRLKVATDNDPHKAHCHDLGSIDFAELSGGGENETVGRGLSIRMVEAVPTEIEGWCVAVYHGDGTVRLTFIETDEGKDDGVEFRHFSVFQMDASSPLNRCIIRASSVELFATLSSVGGPAGLISVWSASPSPTSLSEGESSDSLPSPTSLSEGEASDDRSEACGQQYVQSVLALDACLEDEIIDIRFVSSGSLSAFPWIVALTHTTAVVHQRDGGSFEWKPVVKLKYQSRPSSSAFRQESEVLRREEGRIQGCVSPVDLFPHLIPTLRCLVPISDERHFLRSDWHPDTILAYACSDAQGIKTSLRSNVRGVYSWLSRWLHSNQDERPMLDPKFPLTVVPLRHLEGHLLLESNDTGIESDDANDGTSSFMWQVLSSAPSQIKPESEEDALLRELQDVLCPSRRTPSSDNQEAEQDQGLNEKKSILPEPLVKLSSDELRLLWAIGEIISDPPRFKHLDPAGQLTLFSVSLLRALDRAKNQDEKEETMPTRPLAGSEVNDTMTRRIHNVKLPPSTSEKKTIVPIASAGCLSAIVSSTQGPLLDSCRVPNEKLDWKTARTLRLPFWIRSDTQLRVVCEEIGQAIFRQTRNIMDCALFFIIAGNRRTLRNLAATDRTTSGTTFNKFINDQDFSSPRGRKAAEKNAFSLLRKRKYQAAASFFLLAEPPMLKSALEVIVTQMEDLDLAFLVARMIESPQQPGDGGTMGGLGTIGGVGMGFGGMFDSGGGYAAGGGGQASSSVAADEVPFDDWKPTLKKGAKTLMNERGLALASHDPCLKAIQLIWLGRREEASWCLSGLSHDCDSERSIRSDALFPRAFDLRLDDKDSPSDKAKRLHRFVSPPSSNSSFVDSANERVLKKANSVINFVSCPFLVKSMNASVRSRWASTLLVSRALTRCGIDLVSTRIILQNTDPLDLEEKPGNEREASTAHQAPLQSATEYHENDASSSIFDSFDIPAIKKSQPASKTGPASSIFDSFDAPLQKIQQKPSSIFDEFDTAPVRKPVPPGAQATSSIFDSFDTAPQKPKPAVTSIFDSFDTAPQKQKPAASSIFDAFEAAPPKRSTPPTQVVSQSNDMASSIFDSFGTPVPSKSSVDTSQQPTAPVKQGPATFPDDDDADNDIPDVVPLATPKIWKEWRSNELVQSMARRLLREMASVMSGFHGDTIDAPMRLFRRHFHPLVPSGAGEILNQHCLGNNLVEGLKLCLDDVCSPCEMNESTVVNQALRILSCPSHPNRAVYAVLLHMILGRTAEAEDVVRDAAIGQNQRCEMIACSNDQLVENRKTTHHMASQYLRRLAARVSWQLEICLWLNRGGALQLSALAVKEAVIAVRTGLVIASWGRCHKCLETMIRYEPDSPIDHDAGRQLWSSLKLITEPEDRTKTTVTTGSGGWEFLVNCRREESTEMLRNKLPGTFIIRPHAGDTSVFTLSFKTNLVPTPSFDEGEGEAENPLKEAGGANAPLKAINARPVKKDDVVQHAIIRLSDVGFRCGSFGPFASLLQLLQAVSASLPFDLLFNKPPTQGIIKDEGAQPSPNAVFLRKLALTSYSANYQWNRETMDPATDDYAAGGSQAGSSDPEDEGSDRDIDDQIDEAAEYPRRKAFGMFSQLLVLSKIRKQLSAVGAAEECEETQVEPSDSIVNIPSDEVEHHIGVEESYALASRIVRPLLNWCRLLETGIVSELAPSINELSQKATAPVAIDMDASDTAIELVTQSIGSSIDGGDSIIRRMIQPESGVEFRTLKAGEGSESAMTVLFSKNAAMNWLVSSGTEKTSEEALLRLARMEKRRVIEPIEIADLGMKALTSSAERKDVKEKVRYRFVDPWEVEGLESREAETMAAALGRERYYEFSFGSVESSCEGILRRIGGPHLLGLWTYLKGEVRLTKAIASVYAPWERDAGGDLQMTKGVVSEPSSFMNGIRQHLYRNALFRLLRLPQRFLALVQVELLDLKNLTAPGGSPSLTVFALLRLKRPGTGNRLTHKAKTLDCVTTPATKVGKSSGPNAPASWGSVARFRFPLPENVDCDGVSHDGDREALFKGPPSVLQISVYEKKFMSDIFLGAADINLDALTAGGQLEEWVPLRESKLGVTWFARIRLTLRFELMCLGSPSSDVELPPSVGLRKIQELSKQGGAHEDTKPKKSVSTSDLLSYFESMVS